ncbi:MAG: hypothetical protein K0R82_727 [Flavipsychrobacter sp.]|jgi:hypothetical protein|nr:hypothetical protein [Flavipsychrobacter sp.]
MKRLLIVLMLIVTAPAVYAQGCAACTKTAAGLDDKSAKGLNGGILYLATLPLAIMGTVGFMWWKHNRNS